MAGRLARRGHRALLFGWRFLPLWARKIAIRVLYPTFPVGAIAVIRDELGRVLLVHQTYHRGDCWGAPGGWLSGRESPQGTAARETFEETGLRVRAGRVLAIGSGPYAELTVAIECRIVGDDGFSPSEEIDRFAYFSLRALPPLPDNTRRLLVAAVAVQDDLSERLDTWRESAPGPEEPATPAEGRP